MDLGRSEARRAVDGAPFACVAFSVHTSIRFFDPLCKASYARFKTLACFPYSRAPSALGISCGYLVAHAIIWKSSISKVNEVSQNRCAIWSWRRAFCPSISIQQGQQQRLFPGNPNGDRVITDDCWHCSYFLK
jgi:hypothetical protein